METVVRALVIFLFLWVITRIVGRSTIGELSTFELILFITMGDMVQQAVTQQDYSVTGAVTVISVFALLTIIISWINSRWPRARTVTHGVPVVVVDGGEPLTAVMRRERLSLDDLMAAARLKGIRTFAEIDLAVLEANGQLAFFTSSESTSGGADKPEAG